MCRAVLCIYIKNLQEILFVCCAGDTVPLLPHCMCVVLEILFVYCAGDTVCCGGYTVCVVQEILFARCTGNFVYVFCWKYCLCVVQEILFTSLWRGGARGEVQRWPVQRRRHDRQASHLHLCGRDCGHTLSELNTFQAWREDGELLGLQGNSETCRI